MFVKRDRRSIGEVLADAADDRRILRLAKRGAEFRGSLAALTRHDAFRSDRCRHLRILTAYDNALTDLEGVELLGDAPLEELNLGCNKLTALPLQFCKLEQLKVLWLEDNAFDQFPVTVCRLALLQELRLSGNTIVTVPEIISELRHLRVLALDNNELEELPASLSQLRQLQHLWLRQNRLKALPADIVDLPSLETISASSNCLQALPQGISRMPRLKRLHANSNQIRLIEDSLVARDTALIEVNLSHNHISIASNVWLQEWQEDLITSGSLKVHGTLTINLSSNPIALENPVNGAN